MKLFDLPHSPYATRVRIQVRHDSLPVAISASPEPLRSAAFVARFPYGKLPVLELDDGSHLADSWVIMEYLADVAGGTLRPTRPLARAQMLTLARCSDTCLGPAGLFPLFQSVSDPGSAAEAVAGLHTELARLERVMAALPPLGERELHLGDVVLAPSMAYIDLLAPMFGMDAPLAQSPASATWWEAVQETPAVATELEVMRQAARAFFSR
jgi:glutathione S-transferase